MDRFGQYFRPAGMAARTGDPVKANSQKVDTAPKQETTAVETPAVETPAVETPKAEEPAPATSGKAEDILSMIRARQNQ